MRRLLLFPALVLCLAFQEPPPVADRPLPDPAKEARAQALFEGVRCVVCQHEAIADSPAGIAADMRALVRDEIAAGRTDQEVRDDLVRRYGDFVLFKPPVRAGTWLLWFGPFALIAVAGAGLLLATRRRRATEAAPLTAEEEARLAELVADETDPPR